MRVANYGGPTCADLLTDTDRHLEVLGEDTIHVRERRYFREDEAKSEVRKAQRFTNAKAQESAAAVGPVLDHFDAAWLLGPGNAAL